MKKWLLSLLLFIICIFLLHIEAYEMLFYLFLMFFPFFVIYFITCLFGKNKSKKNIKFCICFLLLIFISWLLFTGKFEIVLGILLMFSPLINIIIFLGITFSFYFIGRNIGDNKARREIKKELKLLTLNNPYIYFRDIPNKYGIGVSTRILNLKFGKKEVLAAILDLSAKGYIKFKQNGKSYEIIDCNKETNTLLKNEIYLLNWVKNKNINNFSIKEWKILCDEDSKKLEMFNNNIKEYKPLFNMDTAYAKNLLLVSFIFSFILVLMFNSTIYDSILLGIFPSLFIAVFLTFPVFLIVFFIMLFIALLHEGKIIAYNKKKSMVLSDIGENEYHELCALCKFLDDFGSFAEKHIEEIVIWEQYLSYALLFRLNEKILKTGYNKLSINDSFIIDDLDKIVL